MFGVDLTDRSFTDALGGLALQLAAGVQLDKALQSAGPVNQTGSGRRAFQTAQERAIRGEPFEQVLEAMSGMLNCSDRAVLAAGWHSGKFDEAMRRVVERRELTYQTRRDIRGALYLPAGILIAAALCAPLPLLVLRQIEMERYFALALPLLAGAFALWVAVGVIHRAVAPRWLDWPADLGPPPATWIDRMRLYWLGVLERQRNLSEFGPLMSDLLSAGMPLHEALQTTARALPNGIYRHETLRLAEALKTGEPMSRSMHSQSGVGAAALWPQEWIKGMAVAEAAGGEALVLGRLGETMRQYYIERLYALAPWPPNFVYALVMFATAWQVLKMIDREFFY